LVVERKPHNLGLKIACKRDDFKFEGTGENRYVELRDHLTKNQR
jgi:hypothetical protein